MIRVGDHRELQAAVLALRVMDRSLRNDIARSTKAVFDPIWQGQVEAFATTKLDKMVIAKGARVKAGNPPTAIAASSEARMRGGLIPAEDWAPFEFGTNDRNKVTTYQSHRGSTSFKVTRHTARQLPGRNRRGRVAYRAFEEVAPRIVSLWVQMIVKKTYESFGMGR